MAAIAAPRAAPNWDRAVPATACNNTVKVTIKNEFRLINNTG
jgi:hypothetical protein